MLRLTFATLLLIAPPVLAAERLPPFGTGARVIVDGQTIECREPADAIYALTFAAKHPAAEAGRFMLDISCGSGPPATTAATVREFSSSYDASCVQQDDEPLCLWVPNAQLRPAPR